MERLLQTIVLLGALQGFIVSGLLFFSRRLRTANRLLAWLILLMSMCCFSLYGSYINWLDSKWLNFLASILPLIVTMPIGPLLYFYIQSFLHPSFKLGKRERWQFFPAIIDLGKTIIALIFVTGVLMGVVKNDPRPWGIFIDHYNVYTDIPRWVSMVVYVTLSFRYLNKYKQTNKDAPGLKWLRQLIGAFSIFAAVWVIYLVPYVIPRYTNWMLSKLDWYPVYIPVTVLIYWLGIRGYLITWQLQTAEKKAELQLSEATVDTALESLKRSMEQDRLYLNTTLTLNMLAAHTGLPAKTISAVLNQHLHKNFNEFVNSYRVELFKERLAKDDAGQLTFAGLANDCGFSSPATFQRVFKQLTGMSPSEFRKTLPEARS